VVGDELDRAVIGRLTAGHSLALGLAQFGNEVASRLEIARIRNADAKARFGDDDRGEFKMADAVSFAEIAFAAGEVELALVVGDCRSRAFVDWRLLLPPVQSHFRTADRL